MRERYKEYAHSCRRRGRRRGRRRRGRRRVDWPKICRTTYYSKLERVIKSELRVES
jgi:hypothetical protein